jgi:hypothetical protein
MHTNDIVKIGLKEQPYDYETIRFWRENFFGIHVNTSQSLNTN